jgi:hypothetical protein
VGIRYSLGDEGENDIGHPHLPGGGSPADGGKVEVSGGEVAPCRRGQLPARSPVGGQLRQPHDRCRGQPKVA